MGAWGLVLDGGFYDFFSREGLRGMFEEFSPLNNPVIG